MEFYMKTETSQEENKKSVTYKPHPKYSAITCGSDGSVYYINTGKQLQGSKYKNGYRYTVFYQDGQRIRERTHRLVCESFYGLSSLVVNHKDGDKSNNAIENIEWATTSINTKHAYDNGLIKKAKGEDSHFSKLTRENIVRIHQLLKLGLTHDEISKIFSVNRSTISYISRGETWS